MMTKALGFVLLSTSWLTLAACGPDTSIDPDAPVAEGLPQNESRPAERQVAEGLRRDGANDPSQAPEPSPEPEPAQ